MCPMAAPLASSVKGTLVEEREACAWLVEEMKNMWPWSDKPYAKLVLSIAAKAIRRGRHLTDQERIQNLARAFEEEGDIELANQLRELTGG